MTDPPTRSDPRAEKRERRRLRRDVLRLIRAATRSRRCWWTWPFGHEFEGRWRTIRPADEVNRCLSCGVAYSFSEFSIFQLLRFAEVEAKVPDALLEPLLGPMAGARVSAHVHPPGTPAPARRDAFLVDGCPRCAEYVEDLGCSFDADRYRAFWRKMVEVEWEHTGGWESYLDKQLGHRLYLVSLTFQRAFGVSPAILAEYGERAFVGHPIIVQPEGV